jgi:membrane protein YdbS with pleckstrin-like domain
MTLFDGMSSEALERWAKRFKREKHPRGDMIARQGQHPSAFYIVDRGELRGTVQKDEKEVPRAYYYPGDHFGGLRLLSGEPLDSTISVFTDAELFVLDKADFDRLVEQVPEVRERLRTLGSQRRQAARMRFHWQRPNEVTLLFSTKHWIALLRGLRLPILLALGGVVATTLYVGVPSGGLAIALLMVISGSMLAFSVLLALYRFFDWRNDHYIITTLRVLHVERVLLLRESRDEAPIERVQDAQVRQKGPLAQLLGFGDILIQTAAATERILFRDIPNPARVQDILFRPVQHAQTRERAEERESIRQELGQKLDLSDGTEEREESSKPEKAGPSDGERDASPPASSPEWLVLLQRIWDGLRGQFTFDTWIVTDGGNTITWRKNGWLLIKVSLLPIFSGLAVAAMLVWVLSSGIGFPLVPLFMFIVIVLVFGWWFYRFWDWQNDIYQVSGSRLVDLKRRPLFLEEMRRETTLERVENISLSIPGPLAQLLNYGTVIIETAGELGAFRFEHVHNPRGVQMEIFNRRERINRERREAEKMQRRAELAEWFEIYDDLKQLERTG